MHACMHERVDRHFSGHEADYSNLGPVDGRYDSYAEMEKEEKNKISHRYRALEQLKDYLSKQ